MQPREGFIYSTPSVSLALNGKLSVYIENPAESGKTLILEKYRIPNQAAGFLDAMIYMGYGSPTGTSVVSPLPFRINAPLNNVAIVRTNNTAVPSPAQGVYLPLKGSDFNEVISAPLLLEPDTKMAIEISAVIAAKVSVQIYMREAEYRG